jgi:ABC-type glycerol-3-phosphate transport system substrate-binding protein
MKKFCIGLLLVSLLLSGCGQTEKHTGAAPAVKNPAAAGTYLTVVSSLGLERTRVLAQAFADQTGIIVQLEELPAEPLSLRLQFLSNAAGGYLAGRHGGGILPGG